MENNCWRPINHFEDEMSELQPECDVIFQKYGQCDEFEESLYPLSELGLSKYGGKLPTQSKTNAELELVADIHKMGFAPKLGHLPCAKDINNTDTVEQETVQMIRALGMEASIDYPLDSEKTIAPRTSLKSQYICSGSNQMPIFLDQRYFKLKPANSDSDGNNEFDLSTLSLTDSTKNDSDKPNIPTFPKTRKNAQFDGTSSSYNSQEYSSQSRRIGDRKKESNQNSWRSKYSYDNIESDQTVSSNDSEYNSKSEHKIKNDKNESHEENSQKAYFQKRKNELNKLSWRSQYYYTKFDSDQTTSSNDSQDNIELENPRNYTNLSQDSKKYYTPRELYNMKRSEAK